MKRFALIAAVVVLAACTNLNASQALRAQYSAQLQAWNAAGVDPIQLDDRSLIYAGVACGTLTSISTVRNPDAPELTDELAQWCGEVIKALAPAS